MTEATFKEIKVDLVKRYLNIYLEERYKLFSFLPEEENHIQSFITNKITWLKTTFKLADNQIPEILLTIIPPKLSKLFYQRNLFKSTNDLLIAARIFDNFGQTEPTDTEIAPSYSLDKDTNINDIYNQERELNFQNSIFLNTNLEDQLNSEDLESEHNQNSRELLNECTELNSNNSPISNNQAKRKRGRPKKNTTNNQSNPNRTSNANDKNNKRSLIDDNEDSSKRSKSNIE